MTPLPSGPFQLILADPPWATRTWGGEDRVPTQGADPYPVMDLATLSALPVAEVATKDAALAMWVIGSHLDQALALASAWGFAFATDLFYWFKQRRIRPDQADLFTGDIVPLPIGMGKYTRKQVEPCLLFTRGRGLKVRCHAQRQAIVAPKREHSRKPAEQYDRLDALFGTDIARLELFSRTPRAGWTAWGNETCKFAEDAA